MKIENVVTWNEKEIKDFMWTKFKELGETEECLKKIQALTDEEVCNNISKYRTITSRVVEE